MYGWQGGTIQNSLILSKDVWTSYSGLTEVIHFLEGSLSCNEGSSFCVSLYVYVFK